MIKKLKNFSNHISNLETGYQGKQGEVNGKNI